MSHMYTNITEFYSKRLKGNHENVGLLPLQQIEILPQNYVEDGPHELQIKD